MKQGSVEPCTLPLERAEHGILIGELQALARFQGALLNRKKRNDKILAYKRLQISRLKKCLQLETFFRSRFYRSCGGRSAKARH
jgi:hypothetical protein